LEATANPVIALLQGSAHMLKPLYVCKLHLIEFAAPISIPKQLWNMLHAAAA